MAKSRPSVQKRNLESKKLDKKMMKADRRAQREAAKADRAAQGEDGIDPDLAGIVAGPQPAQNNEWFPDL